MSTGRGKLKLKGDKKSTSRYIFLLTKYLNKYFLNVSRYLKYPISKSGNQRFNKDIEVRKETVDTKADEITATMTEAQKRHRQKLIEREKELLARGKKGKEAEIKSFRDRIEEFNSKLSTLTEHNDIPRISAAGNG